MHPWVTSIRQKIWQNSVPDDSYSMRHEVSARLNASTLQRLPWRARERHPGALTPEGQGQMPVESDMRHSLAPVSEHRDLPIAKLASGFGDVLPYHVRTVPMAAAIIPFAPWDFQGISGNDASNGGGGQGWIRTSVRLRGQIYSLLPLTTRPPVHTGAAMWAFGPTIRGV